MSTLKYIRKIVRPTQVIIGGLAAWTVALLSDGPSWFDRPKTSAGIVIAISILSASIWHYGARHDIYALKWWDPIYIKKPNLLCAIGLFGFLTSILVSVLFLPKMCAAIALYNAIALIVYAKVLDKYWPWKNIIIALVCVTPIILGWLSGHRNNPIVPWLMFAAFFMYLAREILKDIEDREANKYRRITLVIKWGIGKSLRTAGIALAAGTMIVGYSLLNHQLPVGSLVFFLSGGSFLLIFSLLLIVGIDLSKRWNRIDVGIISMLIALLIIRANMY